MDIVFERGSSEKPKGHALLYFRSTSDPEEILGTYLIVLPITVDITKYVPPFLINQVGDIAPKELSAFAFPPAPEKVESHGYLEKLAELRDDDILFGGTTNPADAASALMSVNEAVQSYVDIYSKVTPTLKPPESADEEAAPGLGVNEVLYALMSDSDKLSELTRLIGRLRYAVEGREEGLIKETEADIKLMADHLPANHQIQRLIETAKAGGSGGTRLADLYLQRCFHLIQEEYVKLGRVEEEISALESGEPAS